MQGAHAQRQDDNRGTADSPSGFSLSTADRTIADMPTDTLFTVRKEGISLHA